MTNVSSVNSWEPENFNKFSFFVVFDYYRFHLENALDNKLVLQRESFENKGKLRSQSLPRRILVIRWSVGQYAPIQKHWEMNKTLFSWWNFSLAVQKISQWITDGSFWWTIKINVFVFQCGLRSNNSNSMCGKHMFLSLRRFGYQFHRLFFHFHLICMLSKWKNRF